MRQNLLFNAFLILSILFVACEKDDPQPAPRPNPEPAVVDSYDFDAVIADDYHRIESSYDDFMFFESHALFADSINTLTRPIIISMNTIFQVADTVITIEHLENQFDAEPVVTKVTTGVIGDIIIDINNIPISFAQAWELLRQSEIGMPTGKVMTFRNPLTPPFDDYPSYIFATDNGQHIRVYSGDGTVEYYD